MSADQPAVFIGSSSEGLDIAELLQALLSRFSEPTVWSQGVFGLSGYPLLSLVRRVLTIDFAVLVLTPDDLVQKRGETTPSARDNVLFEAGFFMGALGLERTLLVACRDEELALPSDLVGLTIAHYNQRRDGNIRAALGPAAREIKDAMDAAGPKRRTPLRDSDETRVGGRTMTMAEERIELERELDAIARAVEAHGWKVRSRTSSAFRVVSTSGERYSLTISEPDKTRKDLRTFALELNRAGVRLSRAVLPEDAPPAPVKRKPRKPSTR